MANERATKLKSAINFHQGLYRALVVYRDTSAEVGQLSAAQRKLLDDLIQDYERGGVNLPADAIERLKAIQLRLSAATTAFGQNVVIASDAAGLPIEDESALDGLDSDFIAACRASAEAEGRPGLWISFSPPNYAKVMTQCRVRSTRQAFYHVAVTRSAELNEPLTKEILALRQELAQLLGYPNYADFVLADRMARDGQTAQAFIDDLADRYRAQAATERDTLQEFARRLEADPTLELDASDLDTSLDFYYADKLRESQIGLNEKELQEYFQLEIVLAEMFRTLTTLYGVTFRRVQKPGWQAEVEVYEIHDEDGHHLATVWCDWLARKGKRTGAWMNLHYVAERADDSFEKPHLGYVFTNFGPALGEKPSLLTFDDVEAVWHEFGHFMHLTLGRTQLIEHSLINCRMDFVEAPSQIMENWIWQPEVLAGMTKHYRTGEPLPAAMIDKLLATRRFQVATKAMLQLSLSASDLAAHIDYDPRGTMGLSEYLRPFRQRYSAVPLLPDDTGMTGFSHVFAGSYGAAYYSYKWAEAIEADLFSRFARDGVLNPVVGRRYRDLVLARGSEVEPAELITAFLERPSNLDAMLERDGISSH
jgi:oligopeptidase A